ncbi:aquaporin-9-like isoform X2 [Hemiscyllium ocellatum]|uniref:aquaporin-9-like isoform X2 n=1 Tax=Hemiscyllium ocellatum TaxID=170820 RepID=UPI0029676041|nr:aquaporin-9-like isoform X2 [Hemiscyllium ocellatum]
MGRAATILVKVHDAFRLKNKLFRECLAEFLGLFGCGAVAQMVVSHTTRGEFLSVNLGFGLGATFGIYISGGISGGHLNPAVSFSLCLLGRFQWKKLPFYMFFQTLGGFVGAAVVYGVHHDGIHAVNNGTLSVTGPRATAFIFGTYPAPFLTLPNGFIDQLIGTGTLLLCIFAVVDSQNYGAPKILQPIFIGLSVVAIGMSMGSNSGYAINPARDFGPRLLTLAAGWGTEVFTAGNGWWWIPIVAPMVGAVLGALVYELLVELHHLEAKSGAADYAAEETLKGTAAGGKDGPAVRRDKAGADDQFVMAM